MITIARLTVLEAFRRRILRALLILTVVVVGLTGAGFALLVGNARAEGLPEVEIIVGTSQVLILVAFMFSFVLAMTAAFLAAPAIAGDLESGVLLSIAARPIRRGEIVLGKWLGLVVIVVGYALLASLLEEGVAWLMTGYLPPEPVAAALHLAAQAVVLLTISLLMSTRLPTIASGSVAVVLFGLSWAAGVLGNVAAVLGLNTLVFVTNVCRILLPLDGLWRGTVYALEPPAIILLASNSGRAAGRLVAGNPFFASSGPGLAYIGWVAIVVAFVLGLTIVSFSRREI
jgi:ABC-type transport system involved in multi-copper enzyme maturation permease subunit